LENFKFWEVSGNRMTPEITDHDGLLVAIRDY
jgi:hypothetical protein